MNPSTQPVTVPPLAVECLRHAIEHGANGESESAIGATRGLLRVYPTFAPAWNVLATLHLWRQEWLSASIALDRCLELDPGHAPAGVTAAELALKCGNVAAARALLESALRRPEDLSPRRRAWAQALLRRCSVH